ncbi:hypothetical protein BT93_H1696 [Corymbia citriodora subsp. variegata]|nr:hypothetical protein BT93_H1696 [Corymbia citriodora subsp. variegata]
MSMTLRVACAGGFGANIRNDQHLLYTLRAVQVLALFEKLDVLHINKCVNCQADIDEGALSMEIEVATVG